MGCVILIAVFFLKIILDRKKTNKILTEKNKTIEMKNKMLSAKNIEILSSINYARRIQNAQLPSEKYIFRKIKELKKK